MTLSIPPVLRVKSIRFVSIKSLRLLQFLRLAPIIIGEHYRVFVTVHNLTYRTLRDVRLQFQTNVKLSPSTAARCGSDRNVLQAHGLYDDSVDFVGHTKSRLEVVEIRAYLIALGLWPCRYGSGFQST